MPRLLIVRGQLVTPWDLLQWAELPEGADVPDPGRGPAVIQGLTDDAERKRLVSAERGHPEAFSWERCARLTLASWERALANRRNGS